MSGRIGVSVTIGGKQGLVDPLNATAANKSGYNTRRKHVVDSSYTACGGR